MLTARLSQRSADFEQALSTVETEFAGDHYVAGFGNFREAVSLSRGLAPLEERVVAFAVEQAGRWLPDKWRLSKSLLLEVGETNSKLSELHQLRDGIQLHEREESINGALKAAEEESSNGLTTMARRRLAALSSRYPDDPRIQDRLNAIQLRCTWELEGEKLRLSRTEAEQAEGIRLFAQATCARAREFEKATFYAEALEQWLALRRIDPQHSGLEKKIERCRALQNNALAKDSPPAGASPVPTNQPESTRRRSFELSESLGRRLTTAATLAFAGLALTASVFLITSHFAKWTSLLAPVTDRPPAPRVAHASLAVLDQKQGQLEMDADPPTGAQAHVERDVQADNDADNEAWAAVKPGDADSVVGYLTRFPAGMNRPQAVQALVDFRRIEKTRLDVARVLAVVRQDAAAWSALDVDAILAVQSYLDRPTVESQLAPVRSLVMTLTPAAAPRITGEQATLRCRRRLTEVLENGVKEQIPGQTITFVLAKRDGAWTIEDMRP